MKKIQDRAYPNIIARAPQRDPATPIERELVEVVTKELREKCKKCGRMVIFHQYATANGYRYVRCPACGGKHALDEAQDTIRLLA
jgi:DNA-directed RNA polymerase subunit RPC12/RpoP